MLKPTQAYRQWLKQLKERIRSAQIKAALKVNAELLTLYWELGREIIEKEKEVPWGQGLIEQLSKDLLSEFPEMKGFSVTNLYYIKRWFLFYNQQDNPILPQVVAELSKNQKLPQPVAKSKTKKIVQQTAALIVPQLVGQIPWGHHREIISKCKDINEALFYIAQTAEHNWSRSVLVHQMETGLYKRKGKALSNFEYTLPAPQSDLARELLKSSYNLDFLGLGEKANEKELEDALISHLIKFLLELGNGFAFIGRQYMVKVEEQEFFIDLLFYHTRLHAYVVVELKIDEFKPEYAGKLNFYLSVIDDKLKTKDDQPSIGLLLCKKAGKLVVEYALKNMNKPMSVSEYHLTEKIPAKMKGKLPTIKEIEAGLKEIAE
ncbi:MAG: PDDEXK nuclease domain-containing protein [Chitinophagaceae bacterium]|nr:PDDEXK nuclease domain-containing protein [Chitinophagaceae bacterium]